MKPEKKTVSKTRTMYIYPEHHRMLWVRGPSYSVTCYEKFIARFHIPKSILLIDTSRKPRVFFFVYKDSVLTNNTELFWANILNYQTPHEVCMGEMWARSHDKLSELFWNSLFIVHSTALSQKSLSSENRVYPKMHTFLKDYGMPLLEEWS